MQKGFLKGNQSGVYKLENTITGNFYIGSSVSIRKRMHVHFCLLRKGKHWNPSIQKDFNEYGEGSFKFSPVIMCEDFELLYYEQKCIDLLNPLYNMHKFADSPRGYSPTEETREKLRAFHTGKSFRKNYTHSEETRRKIGEKAKGRPCYWEGKHLSDSAKEKISIANTGRKHPNVKRDRKILQIKLKSPEGEIYDIYNLEQFCTDHDLGYWRMYRLVHFFQSIDNQSGWTVYDDGTPVAIQKKERKR
jgi:group I intron endonuclease